MAGDMQPIWGFSTTASTGIDKVPLNKLVRVYGTGQLYELVNRTGLSSTTTITQAIAGKNLITAVADTSSTTSTLAKITRKVKKIQFGLN
jgi:hypothetical protein